jgi:murein DD-endopeptidase MepM/ murein hydrolase activator NlpD
MILAFPVAVDLPGNAQTKFGASRDEGRRVHAGIDLPAPAGTEVYSMDTGTVLYPPSRFFSNGEETYDIQVAYSWGIVRYGEVGPKVGPGIAAGVTVKAGQLLTYVASQKGGAQLHLEMYSNPEDRSPLTQKGNEKNYSNVPAKNYGRRPDLMDPTPWIQRTMKRDSPLFIEFMKILASGPAAPPSAAEIAAAREALRPYGLSAPD